MRLMLTLVPAVLLGAIAPGQSLAAEAITYKGTIGNIPVVLEMVMPDNGGDFGARYAYLSKGVDIPLHGSVEADGAYALLEEAPCDEKLCRDPQGDFVAEPPIGADWSLTADAKDRSLKGTLKDRASGKSLAVALKRVGSRTLGEGLTGIEGLDPINVTIGWADIDVTPADLPYEFAKLDYPVEKGAETQFGSATIRMDRDPRTDTSYPHIVKLPGADVTAVNAYLRQRWLQFRFSPEYCLSTAYLGLGWSGSGGQGSTGFDEGGASVEIEHLTPRLIGLVERGSSYCGGAHPNHIEGRHFADVRTGKSIDAGRLLKGWVPRNFDGEEEIDPAGVKNDKDQRYGPNAKLVAFVNSRRQKFDPEREGDCGTDDLVRTNLGVYFTQDELVFTLKGLPHVSFACTEDLLRLPLKDARPLLTKAGARYFEALDK